MKCWMKYLLCIVFSVCVFGAHAGIVKKINLSGNKITKRHVILRELTFLLNDTIDQNDYSIHVKKSQNNLLNTSLFNFATITFKDTLQHTEVNIKIVERWYIWPEVILKFQERNFTEWLKSRDFSRIDYGLYISHFNFRGRKEKLQLQFKTGFNSKIGILYKTPYLTKKSKTGLSIGLSYNTQNEVHTGIDSLNKMLYTKETDGILRESYRLHLEYNRRSNLYTMHYLMFDYEDMRLKNGLQSINDVFAIGKNELQFMSFTYKFKNDQRDSKNYPLNGYYTDIEIKKYGIGIDQSGLNITRFAANYRDYYFLSSRWYLSYGIYGELFSIEDIPFFLQDGLGFREYVRGYEPYVLFGQFSGTAKLNFKYQLITPKIYTVPFVKTEKFSKIHFAIFSNIFIDAGYVHNKVSSFRRLNNELLLGTGVGLDFVTFYDLVWRFEYSINKYKEHGFYLSFVAPI
ncbi:MAG: outer membrane protein assembly factor BamA [Saprospiraceae bacterium]|jgi:outer membrane protein assembly factor BamA